jgi:hypothetical protein
MEYIVRTKKYENKTPHKEAKKIYIFCEGEKREVHYFKFFEGLTSSLAIIPIASKDGKSDPSKLKESAQEYFKSNNHTFMEELSDEVWFVIDTDHWNLGGKITLLKQYLEEKNKSYKGWFAAQSNPSFEIWLYYHFFSEKPNENEVSTYDTFKKFLDNKIKGGFDSRKMPVHIASAIDIAQNNYIEEHNQPSKYSTEVYLLAQKILPFIREELDSILARNL